MDEEGFREYLQKLKLSPRGVDIYVRMLKKYQNFLKKHRNHNKIDFSSKEDLVAFGEWLEEESFLQTMINVYILSLKHYFAYIEKEELAELVVNEFKDKS